MNAKIQFISMQFEFLYEIKSTSYNLGKNAKFHKETWTKNVKYSPNITVGWVVTKDILLLVIDDLID